MNELIKRFESMNKFDLVELHDKEPINFVYYLIWQKLVENKTENIAEYLQTIKIEVE